MRKKLIYEDVKNYIEVESKSDYTLLSKEYINNSVKLKMICNKEHTCEISYGNFQQGKRCMTCCGKSRLTYEYVYNYFKQYDYTLLSKEYLKNDSKLIIQCPNGHVYNSIFSSFQEGRRCPKCAKINQSQQQLFTYDYVKNFIEIESNSDCELLSSEYYRNDQKLNIKCSCGNEFKTTFRGFKQQKKRQCNDCGTKIQADKKRCKYEDVYNFFKSNNCELLSPEYHRNYQLLHYVCECGREDYISLNSFQAGQRCKECGKIKKRKTLYQNGNAPCSNQQKYLHNLLGGELNYPIGNCNVDIAFPNEKIYIEYDGSGHDLSVKRGRTTKEEFDKKEVNRNYYLMRKGWKCIRIISIKDLLPIDDVINNMIEYAKQYLQNHHYITFNINNNNIMSSQFAKTFDFGILHLVKIEVAS